MKKLLLTAMMVTAFLSFSETKAQVRFNLNLNMGARPNWGVPGNYTGNYYYLPEINSYYDIPNSQFIYNDGGNWVSASSLPYEYSGYNLYNGYKVVVNEPRPYLRNDFYRQRYSNYYNTYRRPVMAEQRVEYRSDRFNNNNDRFRENDRFNNRERNDGHFDNRRRETEHFDRNRGNEDHNRNGRGRG